MIYVMSDIHGCFDKFLEMLDKINFTDKDELYVLGDVVDRGSKPIELLQYIFSKPNIHLTMGNHEEVMLESFVYLDGKFHPTITARFWMEIGGYPTADAFLNLDVKEQLSLFQKLSALPRYLIKDNNIFVHAGICGETNTVKLNGLTIEEYMETVKKVDLLWDRDMIFSNFKIEGYHIYCGHNPVPYSFPDVEGIYQTEGFTLMDCGACFDGGKLACLCIDTGEVVYL